MTPTCLEHRAPTTKHTLYNFVPSTSQTFSVGCTPLHNLSRSHLWPHCSWEPSWALTLPRMHWALVCLRVVNWAFPSICTGFSHHLCLPPPSKPPSVRVPLQKDDTPRPVPWHSAQPALAIPKWNETLPLMLCLPNATVSTLLGGLSLIPIHIAECQA